MIAVKNNHLAVSGNNRIVKTFLLKGLKGSTVCVQYWTVDVWLVVQRGIITLKNEYGETNLTESGSSGIQKFIKHRIVAATNFEVLLIIRGEAESYEIEQMNALVSTCVEGTNLEVL